MGVMGGREREEAEVCVCGVLYEKRMKKKKMEGNFHNQSRV